MSLFKVYVLLVMLNNITNFNLVVIIIYAQVLKYRSVFMTFYPKLPRRLIHFVVALEEIGFFSSISDRFYFLLATFFNLFYKPRLAVGG
jgi:hypothetical protein